MHERGFAADAIKELGGGVSNTVLLVEAQGKRMVLKQSLGRLRVEEEWLSDRGRIARESAAMRKLARYFPAGSIPEIIFEDPENCIFAMTAAPPPADNWKSLLLAGDIEDDARGRIARRVGELLATLVSATWRSAAWEAEFGDQFVFRQLRIDPYYRTTAARHPDLRMHFDRLIQTSSDRRVSLVHGDWSPKNLLISGEQVMAIDFEVVHFGDPAFDSAFLLNHLLLKSLYMPGQRAVFSHMAAEFWTAFTTGLPPATEWIERATIEHLGCLLLARVDGKSPAEYLTSEELKEQVRRKARELIRNPPATIAGVFAC